MTKHSLSRADQLYVGSAIHPGYNAGRIGVELSHVFVKDYGALPAALAEGLIKDATSAELPNNATITYTADADGTGPSDAGTRPAVVTRKAAGVEVKVWDLGSARNVVVAATHATSVVAMTALVTGYDEYMEAMTETLAITATGTSKTAAGKKAFRYVRSIALAAASDATANTVDVGTGNVHGLPLRIAGKNHVLFSRLDGADDSATIVAADATAATTSTGDVRGTIDFSTDPDGTRTYLVGLLVPDHSSKTAAFGVAQG